MGLDSCVKLHLRRETPAAFTYFDSLPELYRTRRYDACIIDMNVELFRKPPHVETGMQWAEHVFRARVRAPPGDICVLLFDAPARVPATKDMTHLKRSGDAKKRKRGAVPLSADTEFGDRIKLPEWDRVTSSKGILPALWAYLIDALRRICESHADFNKTVFVDAPMSMRYRVVSKYMDGAIHCLHSFPGHDQTTPDHRFGEGDLKTFAWVQHFRRARTDFKILVWSTDLDNIGMFARSDMVGVDLIGNTIGMDSARKIVAKKNAVKSVHEIIGLGTIGAELGTSEALFRSILVMGTTDFNTSVDSITTDRMLKTFFALLKTDHTLDAQEILRTPKEYGRFKCMCYSKALGNRARPVKKPYAPQEKVEAYLSRCRWIRDYWTGIEQQLGGPRPLDGWTKPDAAMKLGEYKGSVRLVPV